tara:strand:+ start:1561 stop:3267 length:1707 start_codon:yes stop_codon:yes gene_type:complete
MCGIFAILNSGILTKEIRDYFRLCFMHGQNRGPEFSCFNEYNNYILGFHRLAINGYNDVNSNQPLNNENLSLICNGEIYNYKELYKMLDITPNTLSDCEVILHLYKKFGIKHTLQLLDGVFAFVLIDKTNKKVYVARDTYGVRPLFIMKHKIEYSTEYQYILASELKQLPYIENCTNEYEYTVKQFQPGTYQVYEYYPMYDKIMFRCLDSCISFSKPNSFVNNTITNDNVYKIIFDSLESAVKKRIDNTDREIACLLSGGLDSSIIAALVKKNYDKPLHTWSIGFKGSEDLKYAKLVAEHIGSIHHHIEVKEEEFLKNIEDVIYAIESYDTTTVRASVGNWLISKYIKNGSDAKVVFNGDGSDECTGGYMYFHMAPNALEFDKECRRLLDNIHYFDVLRSDRSISSHGLEARTPFLDRNFVQQYLSIPYKLRYHVENNQCEKYLLRKSVELHGDKLLPPSVLWRTKEAFSDGVSSEKKSWFSIINDYMKDNIFKNIKDVDNYVKKYDRIINKPNTLEQIYYRNVFEKYFNKKNSNVIPYFWMPRYVNASDSSARTLSFYKDKMKVKNE